MALAPSCHVKVLEQCQVSPPPRSAPPSSLPLTFFDIPWLFFSPSQPLFFYEFPFSTSHFTTTTLPILKDSLSLTLQYYYPLAGNLFAPQQPAKPKLVFSRGDFVLLTVAESSANFSHLTGNHSRKVSEFHPLVPKLLPRDKKDLLPLLSVQITVFPNSGICIGLAYQEMVSDERTFNFFLKSWASICKHKSGGNSIVSIKSLPSFDRTVIHDPNGLKEFFLKEWWRRKSSSKHVSIKDMVRATFVVSLADMERIKRWITARCKETNQSLPVRLSSYVLTCAFIWVCLIEAQEKHFQENIEKPLCLGFIAGGMTRLKFPLPNTYFGNCVAFGKSTAMKNELMGEDGIVAAAKAVANTIEELDNDVLGGAERWISEWEVFFGAELHVMIVGSPKVDLYQTDFGFGRPKKIEESSIESVGAAISLTESRDLRGGIEVGLVLPMAHMAAFASLFNSGLRVLL